MMRFGSAGLFASLESFSALKAHGLERARTQLGKDIILYTCRCQPIYFVVRSAKNGREGFAQ